MSPILCTGQARQGRGPGKGRGWDGRRSESKARDGRRNFLAARVCDQPNRNGRDGLVAVGRTQERRTKVLVMVLSSEGAGYARGTRGVRAGMEVRDSLRGLGGDS